MAAENDPSRTSDLPPTLAAAGDPERPRTSAPATAAALSESEPMARTDTAPWYSPPTVCPSSTAEDLEKQFVESVDGADPLLPREIGDFELLRLLGRGSFARVYLARQVSLDRLVALKVTAQGGGEARTLASLEHDHIVQVFSESIDSERGLRYLCMQYVPGTTLDRILHRVKQEHGASWSGEAFLEAIDALSTSPERFDPAALRDRETLAQSDNIQAVCWIAARLAGALAHAHIRGVLHRDIKPANVLVNQYGRPMLADFNLAFDPRPVQAGDPKLFGGTLAYMAPEHLDAFNPEEPTSPEVVEERSDIYSLGVVLFELLTGRRPFGDAGPTPSGFGTLRTMAEERRRGAPTIRSDRPDAPELIDRVVRRCLEPDPGNRFQDVADLSRALIGCREMRTLHEQLPTPGLFAREAIRRPVLWLVLLIFLPHVIGSVVNVSYNEIRIVADLSPSQKAAFGRLLLGYNAIIYPLCLWIAYRIIVPVVRVLRAIRESRPIDAETVAEGRRQALALPLWTVALSCLGWFPGAILFPAGIQWLSEPLDTTAFGHFIVSFLTSGLIALAYSYFGVQFIVLRVYYPELWVDACEIRTLAREELAGLESRLHFFQFLAGLIPLVAAVLMVSLGPEAMSRSFRLLITVLILLGMKGFGLAVLISAYLTKTLHVLTANRAGKRRSGWASQVYESSTRLGGSSARAGGSAPRASGRPSNRT